MKHTKRDFIVLCLMIVVTGLILWRMFMPNITVKGHIDPALMKRLKLQIITTYITKKESCKFDSDGHFVGFRKFVKSVEPDTQGNYHVKIPLNKRMNFVNSCHWAAKAILFAAHNVPTEANSPSHMIIADNLAFFSGKKRLEKWLEKWLRIIFLEKWRGIWWWKTNTVPYPTVDVHCDQQLICSYEKLANDNDAWVPMDLVLSRRRNYLFEINFYASQPDAPKPVNGTEAVKPLSKTDAKDKK